MHTRSDEGMNGRHGLYLRSRCNRNREKWLVSGVTWYRSVDMVKK